MTRAGLTAILVVIYVATLGAATPLDVLVGAFFGALIAATGRTRPRGPAWSRRAAALPRSVAVMARELSRGAFTILRVLTGRKSWRDLGVVSVKLDEPSSRGFAILAWLVTLTPGSVLLKLDARRRTMLLNVIDASRPAEQREELPELHDRVLRPLLP